MCTSFIVIPPCLAAAGDRIVDIFIEHRHVVRPEGAVRLTRGDRAVLRWHSDEAGELHLHGYDLEFELVAGEITELRFEAKTAGRFAVTSHGFGEHSEHGHDNLLYVEIYPE